MIFLINITLFASSAGYYWVETVDHYATSINLVVFMFFQLIVTVYLLPLADLEKRVNHFGEQFPSIYHFPLKYICPGFSLFLAGMAVLNEIRNPKMSDVFSDKVMSYVIFATPMTLFIFFALWNPFKKEALLDKTEKRSQNLLNDSDGEYDDYD